MGENTPSLLYSIQDIVMTGTIILPFNHSAMHSDIESQLANIKSFVLSALKDDAKSHDVKLPPSHWATVSGFLQRLIDTQEGAILKDTSQVKAGRQLLCSIAIDIKNKHVPVACYREIFSYIRFDNEHRQARLLFADAVKNNELYYRQSAAHPSTNYCVIVCPIKDWKHYIDPKIFGLTGDSERDSVYKGLVNHTLSGKNCNLWNCKLDKDHALRYFWTSTRTEVSEYIDKCQPDENVVEAIVDKLGLSHFDFHKEENQLYIYIDLGNISITTFMPNATIVDWENCYVGFLSNIDSDFGRTFPISGLKSKEGFTERVFHVLEINDADRLQTRVLPLQGRIYEPIRVNWEDIIIEGLNRFSTNIN